MNSAKYYFVSICLMYVLLIGGYEVSAQNKTILVFDPQQVSTNFQNSFQQNSSDSIYIVDSLYENINNYDALFLFIGYPYVLSEEEGSRLIEYLNLNKPIYLYTNLYWQNVEFFAFWNHIGIFMYFETLAEVHVDSVVGVDTDFTKGIVIDTSFTSSGAPHIEGFVHPILNGMEYGFAALHSTFIPDNDTLKVIIDLYNLIHHSEFLEGVLVYFGLDEPTGITNENQGELTEFKLQQNYPNPFNPSTRIQYAVSSRQFVILKVYDVLGNEVATLVNEEKPAGSYEVEYSAKGGSASGGNAYTLPSGIYFYRLQAGSFIETKKMILLR